MPARRRSYSSRRRYGPRRSPRFVQDAVAGSIVIQGEDTFRFPIVAGANINGIRRVARIDLTIGTPAAAAAIAFVLAYVPEGINGKTQNILLSTADNQTSLYVPEQHMITSGTVTVGHMQRYYAPTGRSLASLDTIWLFCRAVSGESGGPLIFRCSFLVAFA
jgi:hypothetical protein